MHMLLLEGDSIICRHKTERRVKSIPAQALYFNSKTFWENDNSSWEYFIESERARELTEMVKSTDEDWLLRKVRERHDAEPEVAASEKTEASPVIEVSPEPSGESSGPVANFGTRWKEIDGLDDRDKILLLEESKERLDSIAADKDALKEDVARVLAETGRDSALVNRSVLLQALRLGDEEAKRQTQEVVDKTKEVVHSTTHLVGNEILDDELLGTIIEKSNGTVVQHMTRVFLTGLYFLTYYNRLVLTSSIVNRIRIDFDKKYKPFYRKLLPHVAAIDRLTLEQVFYGGMQAVSPEDIHRFASGFLVHDIGKAGDIEYHEGEEGYNRETVVEHVKMGYKAVMNKTNYPREAGLITGYHHEYYGDADGYGYFRAFLARYKQQNPKASQDYCITYQMEPITDYQALAYFPAKMLEIVDIYDSLTDPNRKYKKPLESAEALQLMREVFIEQKLKIDPILFDFFVRYRNEQDSRKSA